MSFARGGVGHPRRPARPAWVQVVTPKEKLGAGLEGQKNVGHVQLSSATVAFQRNEQAWRQHRKQMHERPPVWDTLAHNKYASCGGMHEIDSQFQAYQSRKAKRQAGPEVSSKRAEPGPQRRARSAQSTIANKQAAMRGTIPKPKSFKASRSVQPGSKQALAYPPSLSISVDFGKGGGGGGKGGGSSNEFTRKVVTSKHGRKAPQGPSSSSGGCGESLWRLQKNANANAKQLQHLEEQLKEARGAKKNREASFEEKEEVTEEERLFRTRLLTKGIQEYKNTYDFIENVRGRARVLETSVLAGQKIDSFLEAGRARRRLLQEERDLRDYLNLDGREAREPRQARNTTPPPHRDEHDFATFLGRTGSSGTDNGLLFKMSTSVRALFDEADLGHLERARDRYRSTQLDSVLPDELLYHSGAGPEFVEDMEAHRR